MVMESIGALLDKASELDARIDDLENVMLNLKAERDRIYEDEIPAILHEHGLTAAPLEDGRTIDMKKIYSITMERGKDKKVTDEAWARLVGWLRANKYDQLMRTSINLAKGEDISVVLEAIKQTGASYTTDDTIHPQTLLALVKNHIEAGGDPIPEDVMKVRIFDRASVKGGRE